MQYNIDRNPNLPTKENLFMFCGQCGTPNADDARFCANCGEVLNAAPAPEPVAPPKKSKKGLLFIISGAVLAVVLLLVIILSTGRGALTAKGLAKDYIKFYEKGKGAALLKLWHKDVVEDYFGDKDDQESFIDSIEDMVDNYNPKMDLVKIEDVSKSELKDIKEYYDEEYGLKVKKAKVIIIECSMEDWGEEYTNEMKVYAIKIGCKWYIDEG